VHSHTPIHNAAYVATSTTDCEQQAAGPLPVRSPAEDAAAYKLEAAKCEEVARQLPEVAELLRSAASGPEALRLRPNEFALVETIVRARRQREQLFDSNLFADPAWDMLLDLYAAHLEQRPMTVSSLCAAASAPTTTALRYVKLLVGSGLIARTPSETDQRVTHVELTAPALARMKAFFGRVAELLSAA
jgi:hypothetical protein